MIKVNLGLSEGIPTITPKILWDSGYYFSAFGKAGISGTLWYNSRFGMRYIDKCQNAWIGRDWYPIDDTNWDSYEVPRELPFQTVLNPVFVDYPIVSLKIDYLEFKDSKNSTLIPPENALERIDISAAKQYIGLVEPKKPSLTRILSNIPKPIRKIIDKRDISKIKTPNFSNVLSRELWYNTKLPKIALKINKEAQRLQSLADRKFGRDMKKYELQLAKIAEVNTRRLAAYELKLLKYERRLKRWQDAVQHAKLVVWRTSASCKYTQDHPYRYCRISATRDNDGGVPYLTYIRDAAGWSTVKRVQHAPALGIMKTTPLLWSRQVYPNADADVVLAKFAARDDAQVIIGECMFNSLRLYDIKPLNDLKNRIVRSLYNDVANQKVHIGNMLAERHQTLEMLSTTWKRLADLIMLKKGLLRGATKALKSPKVWANEILAWKFGAQPLINDIKTALDSIQEGLGDYQLKRHRSASTCLNEFVTAGVKFSGSVTLSMCLKYHIENDVAKRLNEFGLLDPDQIAWEVTPWSFVIDWFVPVGEYIQALTATQGLVLDVVTTKLALAGRWDITSVSPPSSLVDDDTKIPDTSGPDGGIFSGVTGSYEGVWKERTLSYEWPDPSRILHIKNPLSWSHGIESVALIVQRLKS